MSKSSKININAVDLFCGAGALTKGLENAGIRVALGVDIDPACRYPYEANNCTRFLECSIADLKPQEVSQALSGSKYSLLAGCAPCQPFSTYRLGKSDESDGRWFLLEHFQNITLSVKPTVITMENVPRLAEQEVFQRFASALERAKYEVWWETVDCLKYGVPQTRKRLVLLASRLGPIRLIPATHDVVKPVTVRQVIARLPKIKAGEGYRRDRLHRSCLLSPTNLARIRASKPGGTWRDWDRDLVADCHAKRSGKTYPSVYGRMSWDAPSPTITTQFFGFGNGRFGHPEQDRAISFREGAIIQTFPPDYEFMPPDQPFSHKAVGRMIGNAVPVKLAEAIGHSIMMHLQERSRG